MKSLERQLIMRRFNLDQLGMETPTSASPMTRIIGVGKRKYEKTGELHPTVDFYYSYFKRVVKTFETTPIVKRFGLSITDALALPINQWYEIEKQAILLAENEPDESEQSKIVDLLKLLVESSIGQSVT